MKATKSILQHVYDHEEAWRDRVYLTQPVGGDRVEDYTWGRVLDEARRMATHLRGMGLEKGDRVAMLSKNCAHFFIAELAIWIGGFTTVAIFPTESADTIKLRARAQRGEGRSSSASSTPGPHQEPGVPDGMSRIAFPLAPEGTSLRDLGRDRRAHRAPRGQGSPAKPDDLAMLIYTSGSTGQPKGVMHSFGRITWRVQRRHRQGASGGTRTNEVPLVPAARARLRARVHRVHLARGRAATSSSPSRSTPSWRT
jgi:long-chain acyl-CoA synthetase